MRKLKLRERNVTAFHSSIFSNSKNAIPRNTLKVTSCHIFQRNSYTTEEKEDIENNFIKLEEINGIFLKVLAVTFRQGGSDFFNFGYYSIEEEDIKRVLNKCPLEKI